MAQKRSIFEDVAAAGVATSSPAPGGIGRANKGARLAIRRWLLVLFALVVVMIAVGGLTRLSDAGLSITEWRPVMGAMPPLDAAAWDAEFARYQVTDQYTLMNAGMSLAEFKTIYWWEWGHRQLGRVIGLVWAVGFVFFWATKRIPAGWTGRLVQVGALGGLQGAIGWWMVHSGLQSGMITVASYRLAIHLGLAFIILGLIAWYAFLLNRTEADLMQARRARDGKLFGMTTGLMYFALLQILLGALVAGIDAGRGYTDWPLMAGGFLPPEPLALEPLWRNFFENDGLVQFIHRCFGYLLFVFGCVVWLRGRKSPHASTRFALNAVMLAMVAQVVIGIMTVMNGAQLHVAITHQFMAVVLWVLIIRARHLARYPRAGSLRGTKA
jgi:cytochrome c oxidase assembly protein subunit 15